MIPANELRIGNWVLHRDLYLNKPMPAKVCLISGLRFQVDSEYSELNLTHNAVDPIPLTPEILEKAGFEKVRDAYSIRVDEYIWLHIYRNGNYGFYSDSNVNNLEIISQDNYIEHLHQLQNLHFALTGTELDISL